MGVFSSLFGGGGPKSRPDSLEDQTSRAYTEGLGSLLGATAEQKGPQGRIFDWSSTSAFKPTTVEGATSPYDFGSYDSSLNAYKNPYQFNFQGLPEKYGDMAYEQGAKGIRREGAGQLQEIKNAMGTRRPGLLMKAGQNNQRQLGEALADLQAKVRLEQMRSGTDLAVDQQKSQAAQNFANAQALTEGTKSKIGLQSDITQRDRDYQKALMDMIMQMYLGKYSARNQYAASAAKSGGDGILGGLAGVASAAAPFAGA